jgi:hypothetical protein
MPITSKKEKQKETWWPFRSLANYKAIHRKTAEEKGCGRAFQEAPTLTQARKVLRGN